MRLPQTLTDVGEAPQLAGLGVVGVFEAGRHHVQRVAFILAPRWKSHTCLVCAGPGQREGGRPRVGIAKKLLQPCKKFNIQLML